ncbi:hypothetical protein F5887DRAFT_912416 [Amanita rubescens]|nr:hypothetical protein F5887DRAFT_912416 [Amanita rubescens]
MVVLTGNCKRILSVLHNISPWVFLDTPPLLEFSAPATYIAYQILVANIFKANNIIAKLSFWLKPTKGSSQEIKTFQQLVRDALYQFKKGGYVDKVKTCITPETLPSNHQELSAFLYNLIAHI